jgi:hypothetical protein
MGVEADAVSSRMIHALNRDEGKGAVQQVSRLCSEDGVEGELSRNQDNAMNIIG